MKNLFLFKMVFFIMLISFSDNANAEFDFSGSIVLTNIEPITARHFATYRPSSSVDYINKYTDSIKKLDGNSNFKFIYYSVAMIHASKNLSEIIDKDMVVCIEFLSPNYETIDKLPDVLSEYKNLQAIIFKQGILDTFNYQSNKKNFQLVFRKSHMSQLPKGLEHFKPFLKLDIEVDTLANFDLEGSLRRFVNRNNITELMIKYKQLKEFPESIFELTNLQKLFFYNSEIKEYPKRFNNLKNLLYARLCSDDIEVYRNLNEINNITFFGNDFYYESHLIFIYPNELPVWNDNLVNISRGFSINIDPTTINDRLLRSEDFNLSIFHRRSISKNYFSFEKYVIVLQKMSSTELELKITDLEPTDEVQIEIFKWDIETQKRKRTEIYELRNKIILHGELNSLYIIEIRVNDKSKYIRVM